MSDTFSPPESTSQNRGGQIAAIVLGIALLLAVGAAGYLGWKDSQARQRIGELEGEIAGLKQKMEQQAQARQEEFATMVSTHQAEIERINREWTAQMDRQKQNHEQQLQLSLDAIGEIVNESGETLKVMDTLESKIREGKELQEAEIHRLKAVANGLAYLHQQYEKPIHEFRELESYLSRQLEAQTLEPAQRGKFFRRMFSNEWRDQMQEYYRDQGRISAIESTRKQVAAAYGRAQGEMARLKVGYDQYLANLNQLIDEKGADTKALDSFFDVSKEILSIHQRVMAIKPATTPQTPPTLVRP